MVETAVNTGRSAGGHGATTAATASLLLGRCAWQGARMAEANSPAIEGCECIYCQMSRRIAELEDRIKELEGESDGLEFPGRDSFGRGWRWYAIEHAEAKARIAELEADCEQQREQVKSEAVRQAHWKKQLDIANQRIAGLKRELDSVKSTD
jgi:hypothetical protein